jgi:hypothetical protein
MIQHCAVTVSYKIQPLLATLTCLQGPASRLPIQSDNDALMPQCMLHLASFCPAWPRLFFRTHAGVV